MEAKKIYLEINGYKHDCGYRTMSADENIPDICPSCNSKGKEWRSYYKRINKNEVESFKTKIANKGEIEKVSFKTPEGLQAIIVNLEEEKAKYKEKKDQKIKSLQNEEIVGIPDEESGYICMYCSTHYWDPDEWAPCPNCGRVPGDQLPAITYLLEHRGVMNEGYSDPMCPDCYVACWPPIGACGHHPGIWSVAISQNVEYVGVNLPTTCGVCGHKPNPPNYGEIIILDGGAE